MTTDASSAPDVAEICAWISATYPDATVASMPGATFFSLNEQHWPNFATIVWSDDFDTASNLSRPGVFRVNVGVGRATFERLVGETETRDFTAFDQILPHPVYAKQRWVSILNPSRATFEAVIKPLLVEAHDRLARTLRRGG